MTFKPYKPLDYEAYMPKEVQAALLENARPHKKLARFSAYTEKTEFEDEATLACLQYLYDHLSEELKQCLLDRQSDRYFIDQGFSLSNEVNQNNRNNIDDDVYCTPIGMEDTQGHCPFGPASEDFFGSKGKPVAPIPKFLQGEHVTLFGPPDSEKNAINAMNARYRQIKGLPKSVQDKLSQLKGKVFWGADDEDSKTPMRQLFIKSSENLEKCFKGEFSYKDPQSQKIYQLDSRGRLSKPIRRLPGLHLPILDLFIDGKPVPATFYGFAMHLIRMHSYEEAMCFYFPKLETAKEAALLKKMFDCGVDYIRKTNPAFNADNLKVIIVLENARAVFRTNEIMDELYPYFVGASLGWHDYLATTARLFAKDPNYQIPVKSDPYIVIKHIKASHELLNKIVGERGGLKIGGMYGTLPLTADFGSKSFQNALFGFVKDFVTQMKRGLDGFWLAHPDFIPLAMLMVETWRSDKSAQMHQFKSLLAELVLDPGDLKELEAFVDKEDVESFDYRSQKFLRSLIVADIKESDTRKNWDPEEVRYNVVQCLQYIFEWLCGQGCVALPAEYRDQTVRVMDDLATTERSRWQLWHELKHKRLEFDDFLTITCESYHKIYKERKASLGEDDIASLEELEKWFPVAKELFINLVAAETPRECAQEVFMPFASDYIRQLEAPLDYLKSLAPDIYELPKRIKDFLTYFDALGHPAFASYFASSGLYSCEKAKQVVSRFSVKDIIAAASFHGNIGEAKKTLDKQAMQEQATVSKQSESTRQRLLELGQKYLTSFGFKCLISAQGKQPEDIEKDLVSRLGNSLEKEINRAQTELLNIAEKRLAAFGVDVDFDDQFQSLMKKYNIVGCSVATLSRESGIQNFSLGFASLEPKIPVGSYTLFQAASLSKTVATLFSLSVLKSYGIDEDSSVYDVLKSLDSQFQISTIGSLGGETIAALKIKHLVNHTGFDLHYVNGFKGQKDLPDAGTLCNGYKEDYPLLMLKKVPGTRFSYSGGGFLVLEHIVKSCLEKNGKDYHEVLNRFTAEFSTSGFDFYPEPSNLTSHATGYDSKGEPIPTRALVYPAFAAGACSTTADFARFLKKFEDAYQQKNASAYFVPEVTRKMCLGEDLGSGHFMGCEMGLGVFVKTSGLNTYLTHQGANKGFRSLFFHCIDGPDLGKGFVIFTNSDANAVDFNAKLAGLLCQHLQLDGYTPHLSNRNWGENAKYAIPVKKEEHVNSQYKKLFFDNFMGKYVDRPKKLGAPLKFAGSNILAKATITKISDESFARATNLVLPYAPIFDPEEYGCQGKVMDSWETRRHNPQAFDMVEFTLDQPQTIQGFYLSTQFHDGNHGAEVEVVGYTPDAEEVTLLAKQPLMGHGEAWAKSQCVDRVFERIELRNYPDGGVSRFFAFSDMVPDAVLGINTKELKQTLDWKRDTREIPKLQKEFLPQISRHAAIVRDYIGSHNEGDLVNINTDIMGANVIGCSNEHYGPAAAVISPFEPRDMFDGFETKRSREPGHVDYVDIKWPQPIDVEFIELDYRYFKNNNPRYVQLFSLDQPTALPLTQKMASKAFRGSSQKIAVHKRGLDGIRLSIYPDGGVHRIRVFSKWSQPMAEVYLKNIDKGEV